MKTIHYYNRYVHISLLSRTLRFVAFNTKLKLRGGSSSKNKLNRKKGIEMDRGRLFEKKSD